MTMEDDFGDLSKAVKEFGRSTWSFWRPRWPWLVVIYGLIIALALALR